MSDMKIINLSELAEGKQEKVLSSIEDYTSGKTEEKPQMLPVTRVELLAKKVVLIALKGEGEVFSGVVAADDEIKHRGVSKCEVGTLWVPEAHRGEGVAHELVSAITTLLAKVSIDPYVFCNSKSLKVFQDNKYEVAKQEQIPQEAFALCALCPSCPTSGGCCDTQLIYSRGDDNE